MQSLAGKEQRSDTDGAKPHSVTQESLTPAIPGLAILRRHCRSGACVARELTTGSTMQDFSIVGANNII